jgi:L,D-transpeptidase catalytic domain
MPAAMLRTLGRVLALTTAVVLTAAATAFASSSTTTPSTTTTTTTTSTTTTTPVTPPARVRSAKLYVFNAFSVHRNAVTVPGRAIRIGGVVWPYVPGQWVTFKVYLGRRLIKSDRYRLQPSPKRNYGRFNVPVRSPGAGNVSVQVTHEHTAHLLRFSTRRTFAVLNPSVGFGSTGPFVDLIQQRLAALHLWIPQTGIYDGGTGLAVDAYHRLLGWGTSQSLGPATINAILNGQGAFHVRYPNQGRHAEGNISQQLLALIDGSNVQYIFPISSGKPSTPTIIGSFRIYRRTPGYLPDGMYFSSFFTGGYAIHGYNPAPDYPASHGCMRLPIPDAIPAYNWLTFNDWVDTYH